MAAKNAWKIDSQGYYLEMRVTGKKDYSIDWTDFLGEDTLASAVWTINAGLTKISDELSGLVSKVTLLAPAAGAYACSMQMTSGAGLIEPVPFRVIVT